MRFEITIPLSPGRRLWASIPDGTKLADLLRFALHLMPMADDFPVSSAEDVLRMLFAAARTSPIVPARQRQHAILW